MIDDTIVALATPPGSGAIALIRISGINTFSIINKIISSKIDFINVKSNSILRKYIIDPKTNEIIDEVLIFIFKKPLSYTGEDIIEISCHGGKVTPYRILNLILENGARIAEKGEFTKRAYLNDKIDLTQAEAIADLIASKTITGAKLAISNIFRRFSNAIYEIKNSLLNLIAHLEVCIDYPDEGIPESDEKEIIDLYLDIRNKISHIIDDSKRGRKLSDGITVVITGRTNSGKSSILNYLAREERAIVSNIHGTTRDALEINIEIEGVPLIIVDTAGIRDTGDEIEILGIKKTHHYLKEANLVLFIIDSSEMLSNLDFEIFNNIKEKDFIILLNKSDLKQIISGIDIKDRFGEGIRFLSISALQKTGITELENALRDWVRGHEKGMESNVIVAGIRSEKLLTDLLVSLKQGIDVLSRNEPIEFVIIHFREALDLLGKITGEVSSEDILNRIFENFCVGK